MTEGSSVNSAIQQVAQAVLSDPTLRQRLTSAASVQDRAAILQEAGVTLPSQDDLREAFAALPGANGAGTTTTSAVLGPIEAELPIAPVGDLAEAGAAAVAVAH